MTRAIDFRLYLVTNRHLCAPRPLSDVVREACEAGVRAVQLREKDLRTGELDALAAELDDIAAAYGTTLFVNQSNPPSNLPRGSGLHFPETVVIARQGPDHLVCASSHTTKSAMTAASSGADFVTFGPVYETPAKQQFGPPQGLERLAEVAGLIDVPVFAIGGITPERVRPCLAAGARGVAVMGAIMAASTVWKAVGAFEHELGGL